MLGPGAPGAPGAPGVRASRWDGDGVPDLDRGDWDLSICNTTNSDQKISLLLEVFSISI